MKHVLSAMLCLLVLGTSAQEHRSGTTIKGKVISQHSRQPLEGATIYVGKQRTAVVTATDGTFAVVTEESNPLIRVSSVGYRPVSMLLEEIEKEEMIILLEKAEIDLAEVNVYTGYRTTSLRNAIDRKSVVKEKSVSVLYELSGG